ncbi:class II aldolase/adducin family protein [Falsiroseomonas sp. HC035]|uniref:class II aldolase/adducin family protein n=1 Tax=Falsiroseomonas sp. HC035 TaxID=3390999 RepID=UPI003D3160E8
MSAIRQAEPSMSEAEWQARCDLAALYHVVQHLGWTDLLETHMSLRVPGQPGTFLINNYGDMFDEITASSLVKMDLEGQVLGGGTRYNAAGFTIHSGIYKACPDVACVMHSHTRAGAGISVLKQGLRPISQDAMEVLDDVVYHPYGIPTSAEECEALGESAKQGGCLVLHNHGLLAAGPTIPSTLKRLYMLERACEVELIARTLDEPPVLIEPHIIERAARRMKALRATPDYGQRQWEALLRRIDRDGADYRR